MNREEEQLFVIEQLKIMLEDKDTDIRRLLRQVDELSTSQHLLHHRISLLDEQNAQLSSRFK